MDYLEILEKSYQETRLMDRSLNNPLEYLSDYIFNFTTYDGQIAEVFAQKAIEVCTAITNRETFEYIEVPSNYKWFLIMCNMPFFSEKIEWGSSIRGCWWDDHEGIRLETTGLFIRGEQITGITFGKQEWEKFIKAMGHVAKDFGYST